jgi:hypothetical protein
MVNLSSSCGTNYCRTSSMGLHSMYTSASLPAPKRLCCCCHLEGASFFALQMTFGESTDGIEKIWDLRVHSLTLEGNIQKGLFHDFNSSEFCELVRMLSTFRVS